jgi:hypothetical protein
MKVSFDFDGTLDKKSVQKYAKELIDKGFEVWICTARLNDNDAPSKDWNKDLYQVAKDIGIKYENIIFMAFMDKYHFFECKDFIWHLDDDWTELDLINKHTDTKGISVFGNENWKQKCNKLLNTK